MIRTETLLESLTELFAQPGPHGVADLADNLLQICVEHGIRINIKKDLCSIEDTSGILKDVKHRLPLSAFRALLARMAGMCDSEVSPYGGTGRIQQLDDHEVEITFKNTPSEQFVDLQAVAAH